MRRVLIGLCLALVLAEVVLQLAAFFRPSRSDISTLAGPAADKRLLCVGDSFTYGQGAPPDQSYPAHLQRLLGAKYAVINEGWPGANSSAVAGRLPGWIDKHRPDVVLFLAGVNNVSNPTGGTVRALAKLGYVHTSPLRLAWSHVAEVLWYSRVYRLLTWTTVPPGWGNLEMEQATEPSEQYAPFASERGQSYDQWAASLGNMSEASQAVKSALERGDTAAVSRGLAKATAGAKSVADVASWDWHALTWLHQHGTPEEFALASEPLRRGLSPQEYDVTVGAIGFLAGNRDAPQKMLWYDLSQILRICRERGVQLVVVTYPTLRFRVALEAFAETHKLVLASNVLSEKDASLWVPDGHPSAKGYGLIAAQVAQALRAGGVVQ